MGKKDSKNAVSKNAAPAPKRDVLRETVSAPSSDRAIAASGKGGHQPTKSSKKDSR